ncbi:cob(I)yrinic acid a,c-diamide adenosyltransferase [Chloroflexota bacterium]
MNEHNDAAQTAKQEKRKAVRRNNVKKGLVIVNTGEGKGKSTAAVGTLFRAWGAGLRVCMVQYLKNEGGVWGEVKAARQIGIDWVSTGDGFTWTSKDLEESAARAVHGWTVAQEKITSGAYDLVVLDEFTYPMKFDWLDTGEVLAWLQANKPPALHLIITGRDAPPALVAYADLVSEIIKIKHPYDEGIKGQRGIEF